MRRETRKSLSTWSVRGAAAVLLAVTLGYVPYHLYTRSGLHQTLELRRDVARMEADNAALRAEVDALARQADALRDDLGAVERAARRDLGWVRPGEVVYQIGADHPTAPTVRARNP